MDPALRNHLAKETVEAFLKGVPHGVSALKSLHTDGQTLWFSGTCRIAYKWVGGFVQYIVVLKAQAAYPDHLKEAIAVLVKHGAEEVFKPTGGLQ